MNHQYSNHSVTTDGKCRVFQDGKTCGLLEDAHEAKMSNEGRRDPYERNETDPKPFVWPENNATIPTLPEKTLHDKLTQLARDFLDGKLSRASFQQEVTAAIEGGEAK